MKKTNKYAILLALEYEINSLDIQWYKIEIYQNEKFYFINENTIITFSGVGKANAAYKTSLLKFIFNVDYILNIGTSGTCNSSVDVFDVHIVQKCQYGDVDVSCDKNLLINQLPYEKKYFYTFNKMNDLLVDLIKENNWKYIRGINFTIDSFITNNNKSKFNEYDNKDIYSVDMEATAIAQVCNKLNIKFNAIKVISDNFIIENNHSDFENNVKVISSMIRKIVLEIIRLHLFDKTC